MNRPRNAQNAGRGPALVSGGTQYDPYAGRRPLPQTFLLAHSKAPMLPLSPCTLRFATRVDSPTSPPSQPLPPEFQPLFTCCTPLVRACTPDGVLRGLVGALHADDLVEAC